MIPMLMPAGLWNGNQVANCRGNGLAFSRGWLLAICLSLFVAPICFGQDRTSRTVVLERITGDVSEILLTGIDEQGRLLGEDQQPTGQLLSEVLTLDLGRPVAEGGDTFPHLLLVGGGVIRATSLSFDGERVEAAESVLKSPLGIAAVAALVWQTDPAVREAIDNPSTDQDQIVVDNDGRTVVLKGILESIADEKLRVNYDGSSRSIGMEKVKAVVLARLMTPERPELLVSAECQDGSVLAGRLIQWREGLLQMELAGESVQVDDSQVASIEIRSDRLAFVSDWKPVEVEQSSQFGPSRSFQRNRSIEGRPLTLTMDESGAVTVFRRGIGTQSYSRLVFQNEGDFNRLVGYAGIDVETRGRGNCRMRVLGDGIPLWEATVRGDAPAKPLEVDISGIDRIELIVEPGEQFDLADHANWANLRALKLSQ